MSTAQKPKTTTADGIDPCEVFHVRRGARETLCAEGEISPDDAVDVECEFHRRARLLGYDPTSPWEMLCYESPWEMLCYEADKAAKARREREARMPAPKRPVLARSTIDATIWVIQQKDAELLREWMRKHSATEREAIEKFLRERQAKT
jgi:hypothetical protein